MMKRKIIKAAKENAHYIQENKNYHLCLIMNKASQNKTDQPLKV